MVRQLCIANPGALYHVFSRGNAKEKIFRITKTTQALTL